MSAFQKMLFLTLLLSGLLSCKKNLDVNAGWKDITIVYGILNQTDTFHYIKVTKAFLGPGNELGYAQIYDSSNYKVKLQVKLNEFSGTSMIRSILLRDTMINNKDSGVFYFPVQKIYFTTEKLNATDYYKLSILDTATNKLIEAETNLIGEFNMEKPVLLPGVIFLPGKGSDVQWVSAAGGKRYQLTVRIHYSEFRKGDSAKTFHSLDWTPFKDIKSLTDKGGQTMLYSLPGDEFYLFLSLNLTPDPDIVRSLGLCDYIFMVGSDDLDNYMEVSEESNTIILSKPPFSNIVNGIGLFASRHVVAFDSLWFAEITKDSLKTNHYTKNLGF